MEAVRVFIAEDHAVVREALKRFISAQKDYDVVGEASDGSNLLEQVQSSHADVIIMDLDLPKVDGATCTAKLLETNPDVRVIALTAHEDAKHIRECLAAGAKGYVFKRSIPEELLTALSVVSRGGTFLDKLASEKLHQVLANLEPAGGPHLSEREVQVITCTARGLSAKEIAKNLGISTKTVDTYKSRAFEKLGLHNRAELVTYALEHGWLQGDDTDS